MVQPKTETLYRTYEPSNQNHSQEENTQRKSVGNSLQEVESPRSGKVSTHVGGTYLNTDGDSPSQIRRQKRRGQKSKKNLTGNWKQRLAI